MLDTPPQNIYFWFYTMSLFIHVILLLDTCISSFGSSCTEFVYHRCWHLDNGATSKIDDDLIEHGGQPHALPLCPPSIAWPTGF